MELRNFPCSAIEADETWSFCSSKQKNVPQERQGTFGYRDVWTWTAIDADAKLVKKVENLAHAVSLHSMHHNVAWPYQTLTRHRRGGCQRRGAARYLLRLLANQTAVPGD